MALEPITAKEITQYEYIFVGIDDTDDTSGASSTAAVAEETARRVEETFGRRIHMGITEHQLFADKEAAVTSDNKALCFDVDLLAGSAEQVRAIAAKTVGEMSAPDAEPGVCVLVISMEDDGLGEDMASHADKRRMAEIRERYKDLLRFGQRAKREAVTAGVARELASRFPELTLTGEGRGVIGALCAVGLRVGGDDGMFLGTYDMTGFSARTFGAVAQCIGGFRDHYGIDPLIADRTGGGLGFHERLHLIDKVKGVLNAGQFTLLCIRGGDDMWTPYTEDDFGKVVKKKLSCEYFELDPEEEETFKETKRRSCGACLYRKLTDQGYICAQDHEPVR